MNISAGDTLIARVADEKLVLEKTVTMIGRLKTIFRMSPARPAWLTN
ncbi:MAG: hypothetical protein O3A93_00780 [Chloroflexi bacterium]|nr:hypothetical protein [Chloroflexota bacterium]MDA1269783.1 hypothetical protein [Chloroflexota bacterium]